MVDLRGKVSVVAGGARDIGRAVSLEFARAGADVAFCYPPTDNADEAKATEAEIKKFGGRVLAGCVNAMKTDEVNRFISQVGETYARIDVLVNVVGGLCARKKLDEMDEAFWDMVIDLNLKSTWRMTKAVLPLMPDGASIVNFASQAGRDGGGPGSLAYATAKGGVITFTRGLAKELGPRRIRVNAVNPGMINTTFHNTFTKPEVRQKVASMTPLGREGEACEVAKLVAYLASDEASFVNGANVDINGGVLFS